MEQRFPAVQPLEWKGAWERIFAALSEDADFAYLIIDSTIVRPTNTPAAEKGGSTSGHRAFARRIDNQNPPCMRSLGCPVRFLLTAGQAGDAPQAAPLVEGLPAAAVLADTGL